MARPIRWDNVNVPSAGGALSAFDSGADRISQSIEQLRSLAQEQTQVNQANYENQRERNTADIIDQLNRATTQDALSGVDFDQFGNQVRRSDLNQAFTQNTDRIRTEERQQRIDDLNQAEYNLSEQRFNLQKDEYDRSKQAWGNPVEMYQSDGTTQYVQFNDLGEQRVIDGFGRPVPVKTGKGATAQNSLWLSNVGAEARNSGRFTDPTEFRNYLTQQADSQGVPINPNDVDREVKLLENRTGLTESEQRYLTNLETSGKQALTEFDSQLAAMDAAFLEKTHFPANIATLSEGEPVNVLKLDGESDASTQTYGKLWNSETSPRELLGVIVNNTGKSQLTENQLNWLVSESLRPDGSIDKSALEQISKNYGNLLKDGSRLAMFAKYNTERENMRQTLQNQLSEAHTDAASKFKSDRLRNSRSVIPPEVRFNVSDASALNNFIPEDKKKESAVRTGVNPFRAPVTDGFSTGQFSYPLNIR